MGWPPEKTARRAEACISYLNELIEIQKSATATATAADEDFRRCAEDCMPHFNELVRYIDAQRRFGFPTATVEQADTLKIALGVCEELQRAEDCMPEKSDMLKAALEVCEELSQWEPKIRDAERGEAAAE